MVSVVMFDVDGVLRRWDPRSIPDTEAEHGLPPGSLEEAAFAAPWLKQAVTGALDDTSWRDSIATRLAGDHRIPGDRASAAVAQWSATPGTTDAQVLELMREQRRLTKVVLLSNATDRLEEDLERLGVLHEVDEVYNSSRLAACILAGWTVARRSRRGLRLRWAAEAALALILLRLVVLAGLVASFVFGPGFS